MTPTQKDLSELTQRVEEATGPDRDLDRAILDALGIEVCEFDVGDGDPSQWRIWSDGSTVENTHITASVDAALALVERLGRTARSVERWGEEKFMAWVEWKEGKWTRSQNGYGKTRPLAILAALLRALLNKEPVS